MIAIDMEMPLNCVECRFSQGDYGFCHAMPKNFCGYVYESEDEGRPGWCPLKHVDKLMVEHCVSEEDIVRFGEEEVFKYMKAEACNKIGKFIAEGDGGNSHIIWLDNIDMEFDPSLHIIRGLSYVVNTEEIEKC